MSATAYHALTQRFETLYRFAHLAAMASWDQQTTMPSGGNDARSKAMAQLSVHMHELLTTGAGQRATAQLLDEAAAHTTDASELASLAEMRRQWQLAAVLPPTLVEQKTLAGAKCEHAWRQQRPANDWAGFAANLKPVVELARAEARLLAGVFGGSKYDALLSKYEPGMTTARLDDLFGELRQWLPGLITAAAARSKAAPPLIPTGPFAVDAQRALGTKIMGLLGFDFNHGRLDISVHPFCGGVPEDVRITTRYRTDEFVSSLMGIIHETGHARYEQNLPAHLVHLPCGQARSMGIHESQSLFFEMQLGRSQPFLALLAPLVSETFGPSPSLTAANLGKLYTQVKPGKIRVDADEVTYPAHILLRYELERGLIEGELEVDDLPGLWQQKMQAYLGVDTTGDCKDGVMQDIHWTDGSFGYFPSYTLGAMYAAQWAWAIRQQVPDLDQRIAVGDFAAVWQWLDTHIWKVASTVSTEALTLRATGQPLSSHHLRQHLEARYLA